MENKEQRIAKKRAELMETFEEMPEEELKVASDLISQAAFLGVTLQDLAAAISEEGVVESYSNGGGQSGKKVSSNAKMYSTLLGKYTNIIVRLLKIVPVKKEMSYSDAYAYVQQRLELATEEEAEKIESVVKETHRDYKKAARIIKARGL